MVRRVLWAATLGVAAAAVAATPGAAAAGFKLDIQIYNGNVLVASDSATSATAQLNYSSPDVGGTSFVALQVVASSNQSTITGGDPSQLVQNLIIRNTDGGNRRAVVTITCTDYPATLFGASPLVSTLGVSATGGTNPVNPGPQAFGTFQSFGSAANVEFGMAGTSTTTQTVSFPLPVAQQQRVNLNFPLAGPYSLTNVFDLTLPTGMLGDAAMTGTTQAFPTAVPAPGGLALVAAVAPLGLVFRRRRPA